VQGKYHFRSIVLKIAVCLSGQLRLLHTFDFKSIPENLDIDWYIHTWEHEYNPNLKDVKKVFPNAVVEVTRYEDEFDQTHDMEYEDSGRYRLAQYYTVLKSFHLCKNSGKQYDLIFRGRTDVNMHWPKDEEVLSRLHSFKNHWRLHSNDHDNTPTDAVIACNLLYLHKDYVTVDDYCWAMTPQALDLLTEYHPAEMPPLAQKFAREHHGHANNVVGPNIWPKIFSTKDILTITSDRLGQCGSGYIRRLPDRSKYALPSYGDIR
jgi:hypothetical protein